MHAEAVTAIVVGLLLLAATVTIGVLWRALISVRDEAANLRLALESEQGTPRGPRAVQAAQAAGLAMQTAVETASRVREQGVRGMLLSSIDDLTTWAKEDRDDLALSASVGIQRALSAQRQRSRRLRRTPIRVRIGLHTGTAIEREGDFFGCNGAMAARGAAMADGGEILANAEIVELMHDSTEFRLILDDSVELKGPPGEHRLWLVEPA